MFRFTLQSIYITMMIFYVPVHIAIMYLFADASDYSELVCVTLMIIYFAAVVILGIVNIICSFLAYRKKQLGECISSMLSLKYGVLFLQIAILIVYFLLKLVDLNPVMSLIYFLLIAIVSQEIATAILFFMFIEPIYFIIALWLAMLPGAFYGIQVIRLHYTQRRIGICAAVIHCILQFIFFVDVIDGSYLAVKNKAKENI